MSLNSAQKNAIEYINGPCLILAGAGSGKTKVIISKIVHLINNCGYDANNIVAITFTNKAAHEIKIRLAKYLDIVNISKIIISTFHSLGLEIIKKEINFLECNSNFSLFDDKDQIKFLKKNMSEEIDSNNNALLKKLIFMISYWKNKFLTPVQARHSVKSVLEERFSLIYQKYDAYLRKSNILDFDDLICIPVSLLRFDKTIKNRWKKKISYLLVDEYQDTNYSQYELLKNLTNYDSNFTLVGDDDQSIYSWRGAKPQNILFLKKDYPSLKVIKMEHNYRSSGRILKAANALIAHNTNYFQKKLFSTLDYGAIIKIISSRNEEQEAEKITRTIISECAKNNMKYTDYAILYRSNYQSRILEKMFIQKNIPYNISGNSSFFTCPEVKDLLAYLRVVINPNDNYAFLRIINIPSRKIGLITVKKIEYLANKKNKSLFEISKNIEKSYLFTKITKQKIKKFIYWIEKIVALSSLKPLKILQIIIEDIQYKFWLSKKLKEPSKIEKGMNNIYTFSQWFISMLKGNKFQQPMNLSQIITKMTLRDINGDDDQRKKKNQVQLMTLHASKGLEFSCVFIIGLTEGTLPNYKSIDSNNIEEERRLTYVGITRAKKQLFFTFSYKKHEFGKNLYVKPSRFLFELPLEDIYIEDDILDKNYHYQEKQTYTIQDLKKILQKNKNFKRRY